MSGYIVLVIGFACFALGFALSSAISSAIYGSAVENYLKIIYLKEGRGKK